MDRGRTDNPEPARGDRLLMADSRVMSLNSPPGQDENCWTQPCEKSAKRSVDSDAYHIGLIEPWLGTLELVAIHNDTPELVAFRKHRLEVDKVCATTVKRTLEVVRHILNLAARKWRTEDNQPWLPMAPPLLEMPKNPHARARYPLAWDEQRLLFSWLPKHARVFVSRRARRQDE